MLRLSGCRSVVSIWCRAGRLSVFSLFSSASTFSGGSSVAIEVMVVLAAVGEAIAGGVAVAGGYAVDKLGNQAERPDGLGADAG